MIDLLLQYGIAVSVNMVITKKNINFIYETAKLFKNINISSFAATRASSLFDCRAFDKYRISAVGMAEMFDVLIQIEKDFGIKTITLEFYPYCSFMSDKHFEKFGSKICSAGKTEAAITYNGNITPCPHVSKSYGHIKMKLETAWLSMDTEWRQETYIPKSCLKCMYRELCGGGCKQESYNDSRAYDSLDPIAMPICTYKKSMHNQFSVKDVYKSNMCLRTRKENNGMVLLYINAGNWLLVRDELARLLRTNEVINHKVVMETLNISDVESQLILKKLFSKKIII